MIGRISQTCWSPLRACRLAVVAIAVMTVGAVTAPADAQLVGGGGGQHCPDVWDPVCGVDGNTYSNSCWAAVAGVEIAHHGPCSGHPGGPVPIGGPPGWGGGGFACPAVWDPVCGVDGNTYSNACYAALAGVEVAHHGACDGSGGGPVPIGGDLGPGGPITGHWCLCPWGYYCHTPPGECDADPECKPNTGFECLAVWDPVCGCDGNTYSNECYAAKAGVSVAFFDECGGGTMMSTGLKPLPDLNGDGVVGIEDLLIVIDAMGSCPGCDADLTGTGEVDILDVLQVLEAWGIETVR